MGRSEIAARLRPVTTIKPALEIAPADVQRLYEGKALFLDARRSSVYAEGHIAGARSFPVWESDIDRRVKGLYEEGLDQKAPVVVYCSGGDCEDSHMLAQKLYFAGFDDVLVYKDGFPDWQKRGLPTTKGASPMSGSRARATCRRSRRSPRWISYDGTCPICECAS